MLATTLFLLVGKTVVLTAQSELQEMFEGYWMDNEKVVAVDINIQDDRLIGTIVWLDEPMDDFGEPIRDVMNREPKFRSRKVMGMQVLRGFRWDGDVWKGGEYYDFTSGHWYNARISLEKEEKLKLTGYYGILFFLGKNKRWFRVEELPVR
jgi:uncharacterized protein (DUF2147 family)